MNAATDALGAAGIDSPRLDTELLLAAATGWDRAQLAAHPDREVPPAAARSFAEMVRRRLRREPVAYIVGRKGFRALELEIDPRVLIPRPETELLVELALQEQPGRVLDVGTGSGAIALAVAAELPECEVVGTDTSVAALEVARANAERLGLAGRVELVEGTWPRGEEAEFDLIVANLPYVAEVDWPHLQPEVTEWEPHEALLAGPDGLDAIRAALSPLAPASGRTSSRIAIENTTAAVGVMALEVGVGQAEAVAELMRQVGFGEIEVRKDLAGIDRVVVGRV